MHDGEFARVQNDLRPALVGVRCGGIKNNIADLDLLFVWLVLAVY